MTYEVESAVGGYLAVGKLTARLDDRATADAGTQISKSQIRNLKSPLFAIRTPTALVTDLGTEFGVDVSADGNTTSHVFRGTIEVQPLASDGKTTGNAKILRRNESIRVEATGQNRHCVAVPPEASSTFVRQIAKAAPKTLDLVDIVAGGDGSSRRRGKGLHPFTGAVYRQTIGMACAAP